MSVLKRGYMIGIVLLAAMLAVACAGNTAGEETAASGQAASAGAVSGGAADAGAAGMTKEEKKVLEGIPAKEAVQLRAMVKGRRLWLQNGMEQDGEKDLKEYLDCANYGGGLNFAVTDMDRNGKLEILTCDMEGSGHFSYKAAFEVDDVTGDVRALRYGDQENNCGGMDIGGVGETTVYRSEEGQYYYAFHDYVRGGSDSYADCAGLLTLKDGVVTEEGNYGVEETEKGRTTYRVGEKNVGKKEYDAVLKKNIRGEKQEGRACFGWKQGNSKLVDMKDMKLLKKLADSWRSFHVDFGGEDVTHPTAFRMTVDAKRAVIPAPSEEARDVTVSLPEWGDWYWRGMSVKERKCLFADLSFAGFSRKVVVPSYSVFSMTDEDSAGVPVLNAETGKTEWKKGQCLVLLVIDGADLHNDNLVEDWIVDEEGHDGKITGKMDDNEPGAWFLVIDYKNGTYYKARTGYWYSCLGLRFSSAELTGDGQRELIVKKACNKGNIQAEIYRFDGGESGTRGGAQGVRGEMKRIYSTWEQDDREWFDGHLEDDYRAVLEYKNIGYSQTVYLPDTGYHTEQLEWSGGKEEEVEWQPVRLWKNKKLMREKVDENSVFLYTLDKIQAESGQDRIPRLKFLRRVYVEHRSSGLGYLWLYLRYDKNKDALVPDRAKFVPDDYDKKD